MWFRRFITWIRARFSASLIDDADDLTETRELPFAGVMPPYEPEFTRRQLLYPRDQLRAFGLGPTYDAFTLEPTSYDSPQTVPLRHISPQKEWPDEQPTQTLPTLDETPVPRPAPTTIPASSREPAREPSQPVASEPLSASLQRLSDLPDTSDVFDMMDDLDETTRRLLFLRRLVRQRVYNEGFGFDQTPQQYRHSLGMSDEPGQPDSHN